MFLARCNKSDSGEEQNEAGPVGIPVFVREAAAVCLGQALGDSKAESDPC